MSVATEPRRWTADEVRAALGRGERDFRGGDLSRLDLRGTDLRGADFRGANMRGACLAGCPLGAPHHWWLAQQAVGILVGAVSGVLNVLMSFMAASIFNNWEPAVLRSVSCAFLLGALTMLGRRGVNAFVLTALYVSVSLGASIIVINAGIGGTAYASYIFVAIAFAGTYVAADAYASIGATLGAGVIIVATALAGNPAAAIAALGAGVGLPALSFYLRRRALAGDPRDAWLRSLALWLPGLGGARFAGADLTDADLSRVQARGADLRQARLVRTSFRDARDLHLARFDGPLHSVPLQRLVSDLSAPAANLAGRDLSGLTLDGVDLRGANLRGALLKEARLSGAKLDEACLEHADLCGADLRDAGLQGAALRGARIDVYTLRRSEWTADELAELCDRDVEVLGLDDFPEPMQVRLLGEKEGLTLYFSTRLSTFDKVLVDGVIVGVLGRDTRCHSEYRVQGESAIVRLFDAPREDLERVAEALHLRVWENVQANPAGLVRMLGTLQPADLRAGLSDLMGRRLERIELREAPPEPGPAVLRWRWNNPTQPGADRLLGPKPCRLFLLYATRDRELAAELVGHLKPLVTQKLVDPFDETHVLAGDEADELLAAHLDSADAVVVLVSSALFEDGPWSERLGRALARQRDGARVVPVLARPVSWEGTELARLQALPDDGRPVASWPDRDQAWVCVVSGLRRALLNQARG